MSKALLKHKQRTKKVLLREKDKAKLLDKIEYLYDIVLKQAEQIRKLEAKINKVSHLTNRLAKLAVKDLGTITPLICEMLAKRRNN